MPYAPINHAQIYYETSGTGEAVIFVHAGIADSRMWQPQFEALADRYQVVRFDMRGFGHSQPVEGEFSPTDDLAALLDSLQLDPVTLVGCSFGGSVCLDFTFQYPQRVRALVMVASRPFGYPMDEETKAAMQALETSAGDDLEKVNQGEIHNWVVGVGRSAETIDPGVMQLALEMNRQALTFEVQEIGTPRPPYETQAVDKLAQITQPVLIVYGDHDRAYAATAADYMVQQMPQAQKVLMPGTAHLPSLEQPDRFNQILLDFLKSIE